MSKKAVEVFVTGVLALLLFVSGYVVPQRDETTLEIKMSSRRPNGGNQKTLALAAEKVSIEDCGFGVFLVTERC